MPQTLDGLLVDPIDGARPGRLRLAGELIAAVEELPGGPEEPVIFPGFVDLQIYDWEPARAQGVTGYLATVGTSARGVVEQFLADLPDDPSCLGAHVEGPYLNPDVAGAQAGEHIRPVDAAGFPCDEVLSGDDLRVEVLLRTPGGCAAAGLGLQLDLLDDAGTHLFGASVELPAELPHAQQASQRASDVPDTRVAQLAIRALPLATGSIRLVATLIDLQRDGREVVDRSETQATVVPGDYAGRGLLRLDHHWSWEDDALPGGVELSARRASRH